jgi:Uma2 family endonuclease
MNIALRKPWTVDEFLAWEERQELRYEFDGVRPVAMVGGTVNHNVIIGNVFALLRERLRGRPCRVFAETMKIEVAGRIRYPDVVVSCSPVAGNATVLPDPVVVFEVLSEGTYRTDWYDKNEEYRDTPSVVRYVMLEQETLHATMFSREGERWIGTLLGADAVIDMPEIGVALKLVDAYEGVAFPTPAERLG